MQREKTTTLDFASILFLIAIGLIGWSIFSHNWERNRELRETQIRLEQMERTLMLQ